LNISLPISFLDQYIAFDSDAFRLLVRFYYFFLKKNVNEISISYQEFQNEILISEDKEQIENAWSFLMLYGLVERNYVQKMYELNVTKINADSGIDKKERFKIYVKSKLEPKRINRKRNIKIIVDNLANKVLLQYDGELREKYRKLIYGVFEYVARKNGKVDLTDLTFLIRPFNDVSKEALEQVCDIYNEKHYGQKSSHYIHGILKNVLENKIVRKATIQNQKNNLAKYQKQKEQSDLTLGVKIALGKIEGNVSYNAYLKSKDFDGLNTLYKLGIKKLKEDGRQSEIVTDYPWITK
jgi:hypothetical protein